MNINLNDIKDLKKFIKISNQLEEQVVVKSDGYVVDGKSIMGVLSLDLSKPLELKLQNAKNYKKFAQFEVKVV